MDMIARFFKKAGMLLRREKFNSELEEEMSFHREQKEKELREAGAAAEVAHHAAALEFGNPTRLKKQSYEVMGFRFERVWQDLHFALRQLRRGPGFTLTAILMLALGIGASVVVLPETTYAKDTQVVAISRQILARVSSLPGVRSAALTTCCR